MAQIPPTHPFHCLRERIHTLLFAFWQLAGPVFSAFTRAASVASFAGSEVAAARFACKLQFQRGDIRMRSTGRITRMMRPSSEGVRTP